MRKILALVLVPSIILLLSCSGNNAISHLFGTDMPEHPNKIVIEWNDSGGMLPEGESIYLSVDSCYWNFWRNQNDQYLKFSATQNELDSIYKICRDNSFDKINLIEEGEVYDRGGTSIRIIADGKYFDKNNSGMTFLADNTADNYFNVSNAIYGFAKSKIEQQKSNVTLKFDSKLFHSEYFFIAYVDGQMIYDSKTMKELNAIDTMVYKASHEFSLNLFSKDSLNYYGSNAFINSTFHIGNIDEQTNQVYFSIEGQQAFIKSDSVVLPK